MKKSLMVSANKEGKVIYEDKKAKVEFYIISLWLLFLLIIILTIDIPIYFVEGNTFIGMHELFTRNLIPLCALIFLVYGIVLYIKYKYKFKGTMELPVEITNIKNISCEHLTFLTTYIIPLICFDMSNPRYILILTILIIIIGIILIKTDSFYSNPTLALLGYYIYEVETDDPRYPKAIFLSYGKLHKNQSVQYIQLDKNIFYVGGISK